MSHFHAHGDAEDLAPKKMRGPVNGACRCADHIAAPLMATRERPSCQMDCYLCERFGLLKK